MADNEEVVEELAPTEATTGTAPALDSTQTEDDGDAASQGEGVSDTTAEAASPPKQTPWQERRISELTRKWRETERELEATQVELGQYKKGIPTTNPAPTPLSVDAVEVRAQELAAQHAKTAAFNAACDAVADAGKVAHSDFDATIKNFANLGGLQPGFVEAALESGAPSAVLYHLGKDLDEAARIMALTPLRQAAELTRLAERLKMAKPISKAPEPIKPLGGGKTVGQKSPDDMTMEEFVAWRDKGKKRA